MRRLSLLVLLALALVLAACAAPTTAPTIALTTIPAMATATPVPPAAAPTPAGTLLAVVKADGTTFYVTMDDMKKLPLAQLAAEGKMEEGPALTEVLKLAGVTSYTSIHLSGSSSPADLTREQVEAGSILDFNNHGTVKLASSAIPKADWTKDVSLIEVK